jgi:chorismate synthase
VIEHFGVEVFAHVIELGGVAARAEASTLAGERRRELRESRVRVPRSRRRGELRQRVDAAKRRGTRSGGVFEVRALGLPPGLGSYHSGPSA